MPKKRFAGPRATNDLLRPDSPFLSLPPSLSSLSMSDLSWTFCFPLYRASGVNTLFRDCIMIYVAFSEARVVLQRESEVTPVTLLNRRVDHLVHFEFPLGQPFCSSSSGRSPSPPTTLLISLATCSTPAITLWIMAGLLTENMGLLLWLQGPNRSCTDCSSSQPATKAAWSAESYLD